MDGRARRRGLAWAVLVAGGTCVIGCAPSDPGPTTASTTASSAASSARAATPVLADGVVAEPASGYPIGLTAVDGRVWSALARSAAVRDPQGAVVEVGRTPLRLAASPEGIWVSVFAEGTVVLVDPATGEVERVVDGFSEPEGLAWADDTLWVVDQAEGTLVAVAPDGSRGATYPVGRGPRLVAAGPAGIAVTSYADGTVSLIDPATRTARTSERVCDGPQGVAEQAGALWLACSSDDTLVAVAINDLTVRHVLEGLDTVDAVVPLGTDRVIAVLASGPTAVVVDAGSGSVTSTTELSDAPPVRDGNVDALVVDDRLWVSSATRDELLHVDVGDLR